MRIFELGNIFQALGLTRPPLQSPGDTRLVADVLARPSIQFHDPNSLNFANAMLPVVPGNGGYVAFGSQQVIYDHQPQWNRGAIYQAGPVREFFHDQMEDDRIKHVG